MAIRWRQTGLFRRYAIIFFLTILLVAMGITILLLDFSSDKFVTYELDQMETNMVSAANDLEKQYTILQDVAHQIRSTYSYRPGVLNGDVYREIELLKDFSRYANYSPLIGRYFLMYQNNPKLYTSEGKTSYFSYYITAALGIDEAAAEKLFQELNALGNERILPIKNQLLFLFPIRFTNVTQDVQNAVLCFIISPAELMKRMLSVAPKLPDHSLLKLQGTVLWRDDLTCEGDSYMLSVQSEEAMVQLQGVVHIERWPLLLSAVPQWLYLGIVLAFVTVSALAVLLAWAAVRPLQHLIRKYAAPTDQLQNEFVQLDQLVARIEEENQHSARLLRDRTLLTILQGYYSERVVGRWGLTPLNFDKGQYCAAVVSTAQLPNEAAEDMVGQIEALSNEHVRVFAVQIQTDAMIAVIIGFDASVEKEKTIAQISERLPENMALFVGAVCSTPHRLSASYVDALTAYQRGQNQEIMDIHSYVLRMVAASESDQQTLQEQLQQQMRTQYQSASSTLIKKCATELVGELSTLAVQKHVTLDHERLNALVTLSSMDLLLKDVQEIIQQAFHREASPGTDRMNQTAMAIVEYIHANSFDPDLNLSDISLHFNLSNDYISSMVKTMTGLAFKEYVTDLRMRRACTLLVERRDMTITEVSEAVGYRKVSNFIRKFKELYGVTPSQYR